MKYYIERAAASKISDYNAFQSFSDVMAAQSEAISHHAFETSKIMQSFAAGWFNNHARDNIPSDFECRRCRRPKKVQHHLYHSQREQPA